MLLSKYIKHVRFFCVVSMLILAPLAGSAHDSLSQRGKIDVKQIIFSHIEDAYEWHLTQVGDKHISIPLPVIVRGGESGKWHIFMASKITHGGSYKGFNLAKTGRYDGKIVEMNAAGEEVRPMDFSLTKNALAIIISCLLMSWMVLYTARWYKNRSDRVPRGFRGLIEMLVDGINSGLIKPCIGKGYEKYSPFLLTVFFFILINNLLGIVPIFPGGANVTGNTAVTLVLALMTFMVVNFSGNKAYWKEIFWPDVPMWLKVPIPIMPVIELFGVFTKPFALAIRLFANIMAGHAIILGLTSLVFIGATLGASIAVGMSAASVLFGIFMNFVELLVAFIQAYVFTMLSAVFIGLATAEHTGHKEEVR